MDRVVFHYRRFQDSKAHPDETQSSTNFMRTAVMVTLKIKDIVKKAKAEVNKNRQWTSPSPDNNGNEPDRWYTSIHEERDRLTREIAADRERTSYIRHYLDTKREGRKTERGPSLSGNDDNNNDENAIDDEPIISSKPDCATTTYTNTTDSEHCVLSLSHRAERTSENPDQTSSDCDDRPTAASRSVETNTATVAIKDEPLPSPPSLPLSPLPESQAEPPSEGSGSFSERLLGDEDSLLFIPRHAAMNPACSRNGEDSESEEETDSISGKYKIRRHQPSSTSRKSDMSTTSSNEVVEKQERHPDLISNSNYGSRLSNKATSLPCPPSGTIAAVGGTNTTNHGHPLKPNINAEKRTKTQTKYSVRFSHETTEYNGSRFRPRFHLRPTSAPSVLPMTGLPSDRSKEENILIKEV